MLSTELNSTQTCLPLASIANTWPRFTRDGRGSRRWYARESNRRESHCMNIEGTHKIGAPQDRVFAALIDPAVLQKCIPGCEQLEKTGENQYRAKLTVGV